jgi:hypothetical protein
MSSGCSEANDAASCEQSARYSAHVEANAFSAARAPDEDWEPRARLSDSFSDSFSDVHLQARGGSVRASARPYRVDLDISTLPEWPYSNRQLLEAFQAARDERPYVQKGFPGFMRRAAWLYPYDGCWVRASSAAQSIERLGRVRPGKVFVFGRLRFRTKFDSKGIVYWWYHVAAAYRIGNQAVVLDPTVDPHNVHTLHDWISLMTKDPMKTKVSVCDTYSYSTASRCVGGSPRQERWLAGQTQTYLRRERIEMREVGLDPEQVLGDNPPWKNASSNNMMLPNFMCN